VQIVKEQISLNFTYFFYSKKLTQNPDLKLRHDGRRLRAVGCEEGLIKDGLITKNILTSSLEITTFYNKYFDDFYVRICF
jgi:hypothetical protein